MKKILNISHSDLDGYGCTILTEILFGKGNVELINIDNLPSNQLNAFFQEKVLDRVDDYDTIFITDLNVPVDTAQKIKEYNENVKLKIFVCDHHKNSIEYISHEGFYILADDRSETDSPECATTIYYNVLEVLALEEYRWARFTDMECSTLYEILSELYDVSLANRVRMFKDLVCYWDTFMWKDYPGKFSREAVYLNDLCNTAGVDPIKELILYGALNQEFIETDATSHILSPAYSNYFMYAEKVRFAKAKALMKNYGFPLDVEYTPEGEDIRHGKGRFLAMVGDYNVSDFNKIMIDAPEWNEYDGVIVMEPSKRRVNVRVQDRCDTFSAAAFATRNGGGGHDKAAGFIAKDPNSRAYAFCRLLAKQAYGELVSGEVE